MKISDERGHKASHHKICVFFFSGNTMSVFFSGNNKKLKTVFFSPSETRQRRCIRTHKPPRKALFIKLDKKNLPENEQSQTLKLIYISKIKYTSYNCEIEDFVQINICNLCAILRSRVLLCVSSYICWRFRLIAVTR